MKSMVADVCASAICAKCVCTREQKGMLNKYIRYTRCAVSRWTNTTVSAFHFHRSSFLFRLVSRWPVVSSSLSFIGQYDVGSLLFLAIITAWVIVLYPILFATVYCCCCYCPLSKFRICVGICTCLCHSSSSSPPPSSSSCRCVIIIFFRP